MSTLEHSFLKTNQNVELPSIRILKSDKEVKRFRTFLKEIKPTDFALSGTTGTFASLNLGGNGFNLRGTFQGEVIFGRKFSIIAF